MLKQKQLFLHDPENGLYGDCHRTCIANLLHLPVESVPNFGELYCESESGQFQKAVNKWLRDIGLMEVMTPWQCSLPELLACRYSHAPGVPYILGGTSGNNLGHSVIALDGEIVHDPSPSNAGLIGPMQDGFYWVSYLVPISLKDWVSSR